jgi:hypothetical protein
MNAEFHWYTIYYLCLRTGFTTAQTRAIAFSSQYVDNAIHAYEVDDGGERYLTQVTQNYIFWDEATLREIYLPFHFVPGNGDSARRERRDGKASRWTVTPDSPLVKELLVRALHTANPYRIGIALHAYADSWAHQHFSGRMEEGNAFDPQSSLPPAGHLQALRAPDDACGRWTDVRLVPELAQVDNTERFLAAAKKIYRYLSTFLRRGFQDEEFVLEGLRGIWRPGTGDMQSRIASFTVDLDIPPWDRREWLAEAGISDETAEEAPFVGYDKLLWLKSEIGRRTGFASGLRRVGTGGRFTTSTLRSWNEAAREHRELALSLMSTEALA